MSNITRYILDDHARDIDPDGNWVLAADFDYVVKGLEEKLEDKDLRITDLESDNDKLNAELLENQEYTQKIEDLLPPSVKTITVKKEQQ